MKVKNIVIATLFGVGLLFILLMGLLWSARSVDEPLSEFTASLYQPAPTPGSDLDAIEADAGITIPPSARDIYATISGFRELDTWVRLDLPARDLASFLRNTHCTTPLVPASPEEYVPGDLDPDWWQPHQALDLVECTGGHNFLRQRILVDRTNSQVFTVYVFSMVDSSATPTTSSE
jgi:hypothetical protein